MANAGLGVGKPFATADGLDAHLTINHLSQFLLVNRLLPVLRRTVSAHPPPPSARIVFQSSELHRAAKDSTTFSEAEFADTTLGPMRTYSRTKLAQILFAKGLVEKGKLGEKVKALSAHPGGVETDQQRQGEEAYGAAGKVGRQIVKPMMRSPDHGALCVPFTCAYSSPTDSDLADARSGAPSPPRSTRPTLRASTTSEPSPSFLRCRSALLTRICVAIRTPKVTRRSKPATTSSSRRCGRARRTSSANTPDRTL